MFLHIIFYKPPVQSLFPIHSLFLSVLAKKSDAGANDEEDDDEFGSINSDNSDNEEDQDAEEAPTTYETNEALTTVEIEPLDLSDRSPTPETFSLSSTTISRDDENRVKKGPSQQPMSIHKKRVKNAHQARPKLSREDKKERAKGGKGTKKKLEGRMKGTKGRAAR